MKSRFYNKVPVADVAQADAVILFRKAAALDLDTLDTLAIPSDHLIGYLSSSEEGKLLFAMDPGVGLEYYDVAMDTIILLYGQDITGRRLGYAYITPINPAKYGARNLELSISYEVREEEEEEVEFNINISDNDPGLEVDSYSNDPAKVYTDNYLQGRLNPASYDFEEGSRKITGHLMIGNERLNYLARVQEIFDVFLALKHAQVNIQQFRINQFKYYDFDLPVFHTDMTTTNARYLISEDEDNYIVTDNYTGKDRLFRKSMQSVVDNDIFIANLPDIYWNYMESFEITHYMYNQDEIAISHIQNGVKYVKYINRHPLWSQYIPGYLHCCNEDYVVIYNEGVYKLIHKQSDKMKEFDASKFIFRLNNGRLYLVNLINGKVYDHEFFQLTKTNATGYLSNSYGTLVAINWYNGRIIAGSRPTITENTIVFDNTVMVRGGNIYNLGVSTTLYKVPTRVRHNNYDFMSDKVALFPDTPLIITAEDRYEAHEATPYYMLPFMQSLAQEGLGEDRLVVMRGMLLRVNDESINLY